MIKFDELVDRVLRRIPDEYDKRQGSIIWLSVVAIIPEIIKIMAESEYVKSQFLMKNVKGSELDDRILDITPEVIRLPATNALLKGKLVSDKIVPNGSRFTGGKLSYEVITHVEDSEYILKCEQAGDIGNSYLGRIIPVSAIDTLKSSHLISIYTPGYNQESDESLLSRYYEHLRLPATSGNEAHYILWAKEVEGVGDVKVVPLWDGPGTVKVVIIDDNKETASEELLNKTYKYIESKRPVGADVTVTSAKVKDILVEADIKLAQGYLMRDVKHEFENKLDIYRQDISFKENYVSRAKIGSLLLSINGVLDYENLRINDSIENISLESEEVPIFEVKLDEM